MDYEDTAALELLLAETTALAKEEKAYTIKIDPDVEVDQGIQAIKILRN